MDHLEVHVARNATQVGKGITLAFGAKVYSGRSDSATPKHSWRGRKRRVPQAGLLG